MIYHQAWHSQESWLSLLGTCFQHCSTTPCGCLHMACCVKLLLAIRYSNLLSWCFECRHDLTLELTMDGSKDEVVGHLEYRADLFEPATAHRFVKHLQVRQLCPATLT